MVVNRKTQEFFQAESDFSGEVREFFQKRRRAAGLKHCAWLLRDMELTVGQCFSLHGWWWFVINSRGSSSGTARFVTGAEPACLHLH